MYNPFDLIPKNIDKNLRDILIALISIQFISFLILMVYLIVEFVKHKKEKKVENIEKQSENDEKTEKLEKSNKEESETQNCDKIVTDINNKDENYLENEIPYNHEKINDDQSDHLKQD